METNRLLEFILFIGSVAIVPMGVGLCALIDKITSKEKTKSSMIRRYRGILNKTCRWSRKRRRYKISEPSGYVINIHVSDILVEEGTAFSGENGDSCIYYLKLPFCVDNGHPILVTLDDKRVSSKAAQDFATGGKTSVHHIAPDVVEIRIDSGRLTMFIPPLCFSITVMNIDLRSDSLAIRAHQTPCIDSVITPINEEE